MKALFAVEGVILVGQANSEEWQAPGSRHVPLEAAFGTPITVLVF